jgi:hypothetical protein
MQFNLLYLVVFLVLLNLVRYLMHFPMFIKSLCFHFQVLLGAGPVTGIIIPEQAVREHTQKLWGSASLYSPGARLRSSPAPAAPRAPSPARCPPAVRSTPLLKLVVRRRGADLYMLNSACKIVACSSVFSMCLNLLVLCILACVFFSLLGY